MTTITRAALEPAPLHADPKRSSEAKLDAAIARLEASHSAHELGVLLREHRDRIVLLDAPDPRLPEGAGARWDATSRTMLIYADQLDHPAGVTLVAHEAQHMADMGGPAQAFGRALLGVGRGIIGMVTAPLRLENPVSAAIDGVRGGFQIPSEVDAYHLQAEVAQEFGLRAPVLQHEDGTPRSKDELRAWLLDDDLYRMPATMRTVVGAGFAWVGGRATGQLANAAVKRLAPTSWVAHHPAAITVGALALWGGLLVQDHLAARASE
ncbi:MAG: hypothetical protein KDC46_09495 [Thermoleophilia bacterium]|nr:hypothetical protein [Thermoleophilia bacterium]